MEQGDRLSAVVNYKPLNACRAGTVLARVIGW